MWLRDVFIYILGLGVTIGIEFLVLLIFKFTSKNQLKVVALASLITYPTLNLLLVIFNQFPFNYSFVFTLFLEIVIVIVEFYILKFVFGKKFSKEKLLLISFLMNLASFLFGQFVLIPILS